jgi:hypothetical protein
MAQKPLALKRATLVLADATGPNHTVLMAFARSTFWRGKDDESAFREQFWRKLCHVAASIPFVEEPPTTARLTKLRHCPSKHRCSVHWPISLANGRHSRRAAHPWLYR